MGLRRSGAAGLVLLATGLFCWFAADLGHLLGEESPVLVDAWVDAGWLLANGCFAAAVWLLPRRPVLPGEASGRPLTVARIGLALAPVLVPAVGEAIAHRVGAHSDPLAGLLATAVRWPWPSRWPPASCRTRSCCARA